MKSAFSDFKALGSLSGLISIANTGTLNANQIELAKRIAVKVIAVFGIKESEKVALKKVKKGHNAPLFLEWDIIIKIHRRLFVLRRLLAWRLLLLSRLLLLWRFPFSALAE